LPSCVFSNPAAVTPIAAIRPPEKFGKDLCATVLTRHCP
jgi:hypothetical protein